MGGGLLFTFHIARLLAKTHVFGSEFQCILLEIKIAMMLLEMARFYKRVFFDWLSSSSNGMLFRFWDSCGI